MGKKIAKEIKKEKVAKKAIKVEVKQEPVDHLAQQWAEHNG
jgi:hypothetical protein